MHKLQQQQPPPTARHYHAQQATHASANHHAGVTAQTQHTAIQTNTAKTNKAAMATVTAVQLMDKTNLATAAN